MKAEERHQLQENDLSSWIQYGLPMWLKQNGSYLLLVAALCFLGFQLYNMYERKQENARATAFNELLSAGSAENPAVKLQSVIDTYDIKEIKALAYMQLAQFYQQLLFSPEQMQALKISKTEALEKAASAYQKALDTYGNDSIISGKASLGLAAIAEDRGDWADARKRYQDLAEKGASQVNAPFSEIAVQRLANLDAREKAPRLVSMMPPPAPPSSRPAVDLPLFPGQPGAMGPFAPSVLPEAPASAPAGFGLGQGGGGGTFSPPVPNIPAEATPATQPK